MTVKGAIKEINTADKTIKSLEEAIKKVNGDENIEITQDTAFTIIDTVQDYRAMLLAAEVNTQYSSSENINTNVPF